MGKIERLKAIKAKKELMQRDLNSWGIAKEVRRKRAEPVPSSWYPPVKRTVNGKKYVTNKEMERWN